MKDIHLLIEIPLVNKKFEIDQKTEWLQWSDHMPIYDELWFKLIVSIKILNESSGFFVYLVCINEFTL
jgi:hypothetical protein